MADDSRTRGLSPEQWVDCRKAFEAGESESSLAKRFHVDRKTIRSRKIKECWMPQPTPLVGKAEADVIRGNARANVIDIATRQAVEAATADGTIGAITDDMSVALASTVSASKLAAQYAEKMLADGLAGKITPSEKQSHADVFKSVMAGYAVFVNTTREVAGIRPGTQSVEPTIETTEGTDERGYIIEHYVVVNEAEAS